MEKSDAIQRMDLELAGADGKPGQDFRISGHLQQFRTMKADVVERFEKEYLTRVLSMYKGNMSKASHHAGMNIKNFHDKMARYGLKKEEFK
jgi:DNA-binding NtrC family response regulator